jgi:hypothetical protein
MRALLVLIACGLAFSGCSGPGAPSPVTGADRTHEYRSGAPPIQRSARPLTSPVVAIRAFATAYINWTPATVTTDMRLLAAISIGQARSAMQLAAVGVSHDYELRRGGISNSGTVEAVAPLAGGRDQYVVVTLERTTASNAAAYQGLRPAWHVTLATVAPVGRGRWAISGWQPEN